MATMLWDVERLLCELVHACNDCDVSGKRAVSVPLHRELRALGSLCCAAFGVLFKAVYPSIHNGAFALQQRLLACGVRPAAMGSTGSPLGAGLATFSVIGAASVPSVAMLGATLRHLAARNYGTSLAHGWESAAAAADAEAVFCCFVRRTTLFWRLRGYRADDA